MMDGDKYRVLLKVATDIYLRWWLAASRTMSSNIHWFRSKHKHVLNWPWQSAGGHTGKQMLTYVIHTISLNLNDFSKKNGQQCNWRHTTKKIIAMKVAQGRRHGELQGDLNTLAQTTAPCKGHITPCKDATNNYSSAGQTTSRETTRMTASCTQKNCGR